MPSLTHPRKHGSAPMSERPVPDGRDDPAAQGTHVAHDAAAWPPSDLAALALEGMPVGVLFEDGAGRAWMNAELARICGRGRPGPCRPVDFYEGLEPLETGRGNARAWSRLLVPVMAPRVDQRAWRRRRLRRRDGTVLTVRLTSRPIIRSEGIAGTATFVMVENRGDADARLRQAFLAMVGHELRTPMSSILAGAELLRGDLDQETHREVATLVVEEANRVHILIEQLTTLTLLQSGAAAIVSEPVHLVHLARKVGSRESARRPWMDLRLPDLGSPLAVAMGDEGFIAQVLTLLIDNAGKYGARQTVEVEIRPNGSEVCVHVLDRGSGLQGFDADRLFDLFERATPDSATPGTGVGLYVVKQIVTAMGGRVWARDRADGGADFGFALPAAL
jgi:signal transduction histidine kinase